MAAFTPGEISYNIKGMILGNGVTDYNYDFFSWTLPYTYAAMGIIPEYLLSMYEEKSCTIKNPFTYPGWRPTPECQLIIQYFFYLHNNHVNIYDLLRMPYFPNSTTTNLYGF